MRAENTYGPDSHLSTRDSTHQMGQSHPYRHEQEKIEKDTGIYFVSGFPLDTRLYISQTDWNYIITSKESTRVTTIDKETTRAPNGGMSF